MIHTVEKSQTLQPGRGLALRPLHVYTVTESEFGEWWYLIHNKSGEKSDFTTRPRPFSSSADGMPRCMFIQSLILSMNYKYDVLSDAKWLLPLTGAFLSYSVRWQHRLLFQFSLSVTKAALNHYNSTMQLRATKKTHICQSVPTSLDILVELLVILNSRIILLWCLVATNNVKLGQATVSQSWHSHWLSPMTKLLWCDQRICVTSIMHTFDIAQVSDTPSQPPQGDCGSHAWWGDLWLPFASHDVLLGSGVTSEKFPNFI